MNTSIQAYKNESLNPYFYEENKALLVATLNEKISENITLAIHAIETKNNSLKIQYLQKATTIIDVALLPYLDLEQGGEIASNLQLFYTSSLITITQSNIQNNTKDLQKIADSYRELAKSWKNISNKE